MTAARFSARRAWSALGVLVLALTACSAPGDPPTPDPSSGDSNPYGAFPIDPPSDDEVVLTIESGVDVDFTYAELQSLATVEIDIEEPFLKVRQSFRGVPLAELLEQAGVAENARIETIALNDYRYADEVSQWVEDRALVAVFRDRDLIPMDQGGPIRIVFDEDSPSFDRLDAWNWSLRVITVTG